jgi:hypothetical protein
MPGENLVKTQNKKPVSYWWILVIYLPVIIITLIFLVFQLQTPSYILESFLPTIWIPYLLLYVVKQIRNTQLQRKNVKIPLFIVMFVLPLFIFCIMWNFISLAIYAPNCFDTGRNDCLYWRLDLLITLPFQMIINLFNAMFLSFKKYYWVWLNTFFMLVFVALFLAFEGFEDTFVSTNVLYYYLFAIAGLIDLIFYLFYNFKKENSDLKEVKI